MTDTDAFNSVARAGFEYPSERSPSGLQVRGGVVKKLGMSIRFQEEAFSFRAPHWFRIRRVFESGPAAELVATAVLTEHPGGTTIDYTLELLPRSGIFRPILMIDLKRTTEKWVDAALDAVVRVLDETPPSVDDEDVPSIAGPAPRLPKLAAQRLETLLAELPQTPVVARLGAFLRGAPEREQVMMAPIALAEAWAAPLDEVVGCFVEAARRGLLAVRIDLLCPACLVPRMTPNFEGGPRVHCEGCGILLDETFPESLAVHFTPNPAVRPLHVKLQCLGSPARMPHIVAQETIGPGADADLATDLAAGTYQLRTIPAFGPHALVEVSDAEVEKDAEFALRSMLVPQLVLLRPSPRRIGLRNEQGAPIVAILERLIPKRRVLSLGRVLVEFPELRQLVPNAGFFSQMTCFQAIAVAVRAPSVEAAQELRVQLGGARLTYGSDNVILAVYGAASLALDDLSRIDRAGKLWAMVEGTVFEQPLGKQTVPMGPGIDRAYTLLGASVPGQIAVPYEATQSGEIGLALLARGKGAVPAAVSAPPEPAAWLVL